MSIFVKRKNKESHKKIPRKPPSFGPLSSSSLTSHIILPQHRDFLCSPQSSGSRREKRSLMEKSNVGGSSMTPSTVSGARLTCPVIVRHRERLKKSSSASFADDFNGFFSRLSRSWMPRETSRPCITTFAVRSAIAGTPALKHEKAGLFLVSGLTFS